MRAVVAQHMPTLEAWLARFDAWWDGLSRRERVMVGGLAAILAAVLLVFGVVKPLQAARAQALADIRQYETLTARIRAAGRLEPARAPQRTGTPAAIVAGSASSLGLTAATEPSGGGVRAKIADAPYEGVMAWIADVSKTSALAPARVSIVRGAAAGHVSATVEFQP